MLACPNEVQFGMDAMHDLQDSEDGRTDAQQMMPVWVYGRRNVCPGCHHGAWGQE